MVRRTGRDCQSLSSAQKKRVLSKLRQESAQTIREKWRDLTKGSVRRRRKQLEKCGEECFGCPDQTNPMYPVCSSRDCSPRCSGVAAAMGYARRLGAESVIKNLQEAENECQRLRKILRSKNSKKRHSSSKHSRKKRSHKKKS